MPRAISDAGSSDEIEYVDWQGRPAMFRRVPRASPSEELYAVSRDVRPTPSGLEWSGVVSVDLSDFAGWTAPPDQPADAALGALTMVHPCDRRLGYVNTPGSSDMSPLSSRTDSLHREEWASWPDDLDDPVSLVRCPAAFSLTRAWVPRFQFPQWSPGKPRVEVCCFRSVTFLIGSCNREPSHFCLCTQPDGTACWHAVCDQHFYFPIVASVGFCNCCLDLHSNLANA